MSRCAGMDTASLCACNPRPGHSSCWHTDRLAEDVVPAQVLRAHPCYTHRHLTSLNDDCTIPKKG
jgi:hypothetical protein